MKLYEITRLLEQTAPLAYQEDYDNAGLIVGQPAMEITQALITLDCTEDVVNEAISHGCQLIIAHHPIVFKGLKKFNGKNYVERVVEKAIKHNIALYASHTNLDSVATGVNARICHMLGLQNYHVLAPKAGILRKLITFVPLNHANQVRDALFNAGAGHIGNYSNVSYNTEGFGTFMAGPAANPFVGNLGEVHRENEVRMEIIFDAHIESRLLGALVTTHPYEEVAYDIVPLTNTHLNVGSGMIGELEYPMDELQFLHHLKTSMRTQVIRHTRLRGKSVKRVAVCGGSGSFLLPRALAAQADVFVSADFKYHEFFDAEDKLIIADIGHFESEQFTCNLMYDIIRKNFPTFAVRLSEVNTNPIKYLI